MTDRDTLLRILALARWAPSGDNTQPWRFRIRNDRHFEIHGFDTREWCLYDLDGYASLIAHGALLETIRIAATGSGVHAEWRLQDESPEAKPVYDVFLSEAEGQEPDPLLAHIERRAVQRRPMRMQALTEQQKASLVDAVGEDFELKFFETFGARWHIARLLWRSAYIRLSAPEAFEVHREIIDWGKAFSEDRIPERAVGVDVATARLMKWVMHSWQRVQFFNKYLGGTIAPRLQLDLLTGMACAAHIALQPKQAPRTRLDYVAVGVALQRMWLTATARDLCLQPEMTPIIFRWYVQAGRRLSRVPELDDLARRLAEDIDSTVEVARDAPLSFLCRVGSGPQPRSRSLRKPLGDLMIDDDGGDENAMSH